MKSRWVEVEMPRGGKLRVRVHRSSRIHISAVHEKTVAVPMEDFDPIVMRELKRIYPTDCHLCQDQMCPTADQCDTCKMKQKPARTVRKGADE